MKDRRSPETDGGGAEPAWVPPRDTIITPVPARPRALYRWLGILLVLNGVLLAILAEAPTHDGITVVSAGSKPGETRIEHWDDPSSTNHRYRLIGVPMAIVGVIVVRSTRRRGRARTHALVARARFALPPSPGWVRMEPVVIGQRTRLRYPPRRLSMTCVIWVDDQPVGAAGFAHDGERFDPRGTFTARGPVVVGQPVALVRTDGALAMASREDLRPLDDVRGRVESATVTRFVLELLGWSADAAPLTAGAGFRVSARALRGSAPIEELRQAARESALRALGTKIWVSALGVVVLVAFLASVTVSWPVLIGLTLAAWPVLVRAQRWVLQPLTVAIVRFGEIDAEEAPLVAGLLARQGMVVRELRALAAEPAAAGKRQ